jgi:sialic acid synthase SpsE
MAKVAEIEEAVETARDSGCIDIVLLKATSTYPAKPVDTNISTLPHMREMFRCEVGLSDHTMGVGVAVASVALGAVMIEKHFTLSRADGGVDSAFSAEPDELKDLVIETERAWQSLGEVSYGPIGGENSSLAFRRSLYLVKDMKKGDQITRENMRAIRPGFGLAPKHYEQVIGKIINRDVKRGTALSWDLIG